MKRVLITGASSGIGKALYDYFNEFSPTFWHVEGLSRRGPDITFDLSKDFEEENYGSIADLGSFNLVLNCAGIMPFEEDENVMKVNFWGPVKLTEFLIARDKIYNDGLIINIASIAATRPDKDLPIYAASKAALISYTKSMALKYAKTYRFLTVSPGFYNTNLVEGPLPDPLKASIPLGYVEHPETLGPIIEALYNCKYITGTDIVIDGGVSI